MITVAYDNVWARVVSNMSKDERQEIRETLGCMIDGYQYSDAFREGRWDGITSFFRYGKFPTGLMHILKQAKPDTRFIDQRLPNRSENLPLRIKDAKLRNYQEKALETFLSNERGIVKLATRSGKTFIAAAATQILGKKTLFVTHLKNLLVQTMDEYEARFYIAPGCVGAGKWQPEYVTIGTFQTLARRLKAKGNKEAEKFLAGIEFVIFDEVHRASKDYQSISSALYNARWRLGLSATACLTDQYNAMSSQALTGPIIYEIPISQLIGQGMVAKPFVRFLDIAEKAHIPHNERDDWISIYSHSIVNFDARNRLIADTAVALAQDDKSVLILVEWIEHGRTLLNLLSQRVVAQFLSGEDRTDARRKALSNLQVRTLDVLISTGIFDEGVDIPGLDAVIMAAGGKSPISVYQKYGRSMTKTKHKQNALIVDFIDRSHKLVLEHSLDRRAIVENDPAFEVITVEVKKE